MWTNRECAGRAGALFFLSETGMNNSRACHNTPECFISSQHCHKINTSSATVLCFSTSCWSFRRPLSSCALPYTLLQKCPTFYLDFTFPRASLSRALQKKSTSWCEVRCYLSQPSVQGVDIRTGVLVCRCN